MPIKIDSEARLTASAQNLTAGRLIRRARDLAEMPQGAFGTVLGRRLGLRGLSQSAISDWELAKRQVPAAAVIAAAQVVKVDPAELFAAENQRAKIAVRLGRDLERLLGELTPEQERRLRTIAALRRV